MYNRIRVRLLKDVENLKEGTELEVDTKVFMGSPVYRVTTDKGQVWIGIKAARALIQ